MPKPQRELIEVRCPCCEATLKVDPELRTVIAHEEHKRPPVIEDLREAVHKLKGEEARRAEAFDKSFEQHKNSKDVLARKFDELLKQAKQDPTGAPPPRPFDLD